MELSNSTPHRTRRSSCFLTSPKLADLVAAPLTEIQTVEQMKAAAPQLGAQAPKPPIPPKVQTELVHDMLDRQYRSLLNEPVPMLGGISPRAAARSARGRTSLAIWIKHLENHSSQAPDPNDPMATYDFTWLWRELKIEHLRN
jgi:hypothetical protein